MAAEEIWKCKKVEQYQDVYFDKTPRAFAQAKWEEAEKRYG